MPSDYFAEICNSSLHDTHEAEKIFLNHQTHIFITHQDDKYKIIKEISQTFNVSLTTIRVCGSAHLGKSPHKNTPFTEGTSDFDISIIDSGLFAKYLSIASDNSKNLSDLTSFPIDSRSQQPTRDQFCLYAARGIFRPDLMPRCHQRAYWFNFFNKLSEKYKIFSTINAGIYLSESIFIEKQRSSINLIRNPKIVEAV